LTNPAIGDREKRQAMNEFQAILVEVVFFAARFALPAAIIIISAVLLNHYFGKEQEIDEPPPEVAK
jgi:hypothetical protein